MTKVGTGGGERRMTKAGTSERLQGTSRIPHRCLTYVCSEPVPPSLPGLVIVIVVPAST